MSNDRLLEWLRAADRTSAWTTAVCTGTFLLAAAGILNGRQATTHWAGVEQLSQFGVTSSKDRVVIDGKYATGAGVSAGIDMALTLASRIAGDDEAQTVQLIIEYAPEPPYNAGSPQTAAAAVVERAVRVLSS